MFCLAHGEQMHRDLRLCKMELHGLYLAVIFDAGRVRMPRRNPFVEVHGVDGHHCGEAAQMITDLKPKRPGREKSPWFQIGQFLFLLALAVAVFLLAQSMVRHRFFQGGRIDRYGHIKQ
jgi:hypothetical protein